MIHLDDKRPTAKEPPRGPKVSTTESVASIVKDLYRETGLALSISTSRSMRAMIRRCTHQSWTESTLTSSGRARTFSHASIIP